MVVADGSILTASETENPDLFWGIRGGGSNFGACTEFVLKLYEQRRTVFAGVWVFPPPALERVTQVTRDWWNKGPSPNEGMIHIFSRAPTDGSVSVLIYELYET